MEMRRKVMVGKVIEADRGKPIVAVVSTQDKDLAGDVIHQAANERGQGWLLDGFNRAGRIYWMHDPFRPNLAKARAWVDDSRLMLSVEFDQGDEFARELDRKYREGFLSEWSVGFRPVEGKYAVNEAGGYDFFESVLDEVSAVNQGMNPHTETVSKYLHAADDVRAALDGYEARLREIEAAVMRAASEREQAAALRLLDSLDRLRTGA
jgi:hypothetical protein